jgi:hypothetical protein
MCALRLLMSRVARIEEGARVAVGSSVGSQEALCDPLLIANAIEQDLLAPLWTSST